MSQHTYLCVSLRVEASEGGPVGAAQLSEALREMCEAKGWRGQVTVSAHPYEVVVFLSPSE